jgi:hypothetical protein
MRDREIRKELQEMRDAAQVLIKKSYRLESLLGDVSTPPTSNRLTEEERLKLIGPLRKKMSAR